MKIRVVLASLLLASVGSSSDLLAQAKRTSKKAATPAKATSTNKTRERRTAAAEAPATQTSPIADPKQPSAPAEKTVVETKPTADPTDGAAKQTSSQIDATSSPDANNTPAKPEDPVAELRDEIDSAPSGPERIRLQLKLAEELVSTGKKSEALSLLHSVTQTDVFDPQGFYNVGNSFARLNDTDGAVEAYRKAIEQRKGRYSRALNNLGVVMLRVGRWDESYDALMSALKLESFHYPEASYNLGRLYAARGQNDLAVREWHRVLALDPDHKAAADALARIATEDRVVVAPTRAAVSKPAGSAIAANSAAEKPNSIKTVNSAPRSQRSLVLDQVSFDFLQRARSSTEKGNAQDAIDNYRRLLSREGGYFPPANLEMGFALVSMRRFAEAQASLQMVVDRDGDRFPISYFHLARVYEQQGDLKQAEALFSRAASAFGLKNTQFLLDVSRVREKQGDFKGALEAMEQYVSAMQKQGREPSWSDERLTALRQKVTSVPK